MHRYIENLADVVDLREVTLKGWVRGIRSSGKLHFITLPRDGSGETQCVRSGHRSPESGLLKRPGG